MADDIEIIKAVLGGDAQRFSELVDNYQNAAINIAYSFIGNFEDAKDISQNSFVKAYFRLKSFRKEAKFSTWLYRIIVNECKDFFKSKNRQIKPILRYVSEGEEMDSMFEVEDRAVSPSQHLENREFAYNLQSCIDRLRGKQKIAFVLHHLNGLSIEDSAVIMGCRMGTVKSHIYRACEALRIYMKPYLSEEARNEKYKLDCLA